MEAQVSIGPLAFRFVRASHAVVASFEVISILPTRAGQLLSVREHDASFVVVDHREHPEATSRVEFWAATGECELPLSGLFVLADAIRPNQAENAPRTLTSLATIEAHLAVPAR